MPYPERHASGQSLVDYLLEREGPPDLNKIKADLEAGWASLQKNPAPTTDPPKELETLQQD